MNKEKAIIFDIDGTIANISHRVHLVSGKNKNWSAFSVAMDKDLPMTENINKITKNHELGFKILLVSGRSEQFREKTEKWLKKYVHIDDYLLFLRKDNDRRPSFRVKKEILKQLRERFFIKYAFDDNEKDIEMYTEEGIEAFNTKNL